MIKNIIGEDKYLAIPSTEYAFQIPVEFSDVGFESIIIQQFPEQKRIISFSFWIFDEAEQKGSTLHRELCGIFLHCRCMNITSLDLFFPFPCFVTTKLSFFHGDVKTVIPPVFQIPSHNNEVPDFEDDLDAGMESCFSR